MPLGERERKKQEWEREGEERKCHDDGWNRDRVTDWLAPPGEETTADICI